MSAIPHDMPASPATELPKGGVDWWLLVATVALIGLGFTMSLSASSLMADQQYGDALHFVVRQASGLVLGLLFGGTVLMLPWTGFRRASLPIYLGVLAMMIAVFAFPAVNGSHRWIKVGFLNIQPSEYAKVALILILSDFLAANEGRLGDLLGTLLPSMTLPAFLVLAVLFEPDFGSTVILVTLSGVLLFVAGLRWAWVVGLGGAAVVALAGVMLLEPYRVRRLLSFVDPMSDPAGAGYQVVQGWVALAAGGPFGDGLAEGLSKHGFLPEAHTDFISAVIGEELGATGFLIMTALYVVLVWRGLRIAERARDLYGMLVASGLTTLLGMQAVINLGVVVGFLPAKGLVLPFLSYGASAITVHTVCVAMLLRIGREGGER